MWGGRGGETRIGNVSEDVKCSNSKHRSHHAGSWEGQPSLDPRAVKGVNSEVFLHPVIYKNCSIKKLSFPRATSVHSLVYSLYKPRLLTTNTIEVIP